MSKLLELMSLFYDAQEDLSRAEEARDSFLEPILIALGATGGGVSSCSIDGDHLDIVRSGSCRGSGWDDDYKFPLAIFTCEDPLKAAAEYVSTQKKAKEDADRARKLAELKRLQAELDQ